jgi:hypothetical protein
VATVSRWENAPTLRKVVRLTYAMIDLYCRSYAHPPSAVTFDRSLGFRLFERGARSLRLTEEGETLHARTEGLLNDITEVGDALSAELSRPRGRLRISAPVPFAHVARGRIAAGFTAAYPEVDLEITACRRRRTARRVRGAAGLSIFRSCHRRFTTDYAATAQSTSRVR